MILSAYVANRPQCDQPIELPQLGLSWTRQHHDSEKSLRFGEAVCSIYALCFRNSNAQDAGKKIEEYIRL
jgi:hypothetical protein